MVGELKDKVREISIIAQPVEPSTRTGLLQVEPQRAAIQLTEQQARDLLDRWKDISPGSPIELTFLTGDRPILHLQVTNARFGD